MRTATTTAPRGWHPGLIEHRFAGGPATYSAEGHSCDCVISAGAPVKRFYGTEVLRIDRASVDLSRIKSGGVPLLDSHSQASVAAVLGRIDSAWITGGRLWGRIVFAQTPQGRQAEAMVSRGELRGVSAGYAVSEWEVKDGKGHVIDPELEGVRWGDDLTYTATRWTLLEGSLVGVPADLASSIRSFGQAAAGDAADVRALCLARMLARQRMTARMSGRYD